MSACLNVFLFSFKEVDEEDDDQEKETGAGQESSVANGAGTAGDAEDKENRDNLPVNLTGWDQQLPEKVVDTIANCDKLNYCLESASTLSGGMVS